MGIKVKIALFLILILVVTGVVYISIEIIYPRDNGVQGSLDGNTTTLELKKSEKDNHYYISFLHQENGNKEIKLECTKEEYDFLTEGKMYHIYYKVNFFNRVAGKVLKLDDKPIYNGNNEVALYKESKIFYS